MSCFFFWQRSWCASWNAVCTSLWMVIFFVTFLLSRLVKVLLLHTCFVLIFQGITFDEFRSFFQFLNNLEDFAIAMQMYNFASRSIGQGKEQWQMQTLRVAVYRFCVTSSGLACKKVFIVSPTRWVCESSVCGHWAEADTSPCAHHLQDLWCWSWRPAFL